MRKPKIKLRYFALTCALLALAILATVPALARDKIPCTATDRKHLDDLYNNPNLEAVLNKQSTKDLVFIQTRVAACISDINGNFNNDARLIDVPRQKLVDIVSYMTVISEVQLVMLERLTDNCIGGVE